MNSAEFIAALAQKLQLTKGETDRRVEDVISVLTSELLKNNVVSIYGFGSFEVKKREERINVNPANGKRLLIPPKLIVKFKASSTLKDRIKS